MANKDQPVVRMASIACCVMLKAMGLEPIVQMVTRDRNRISLQSDILGAAGLGLNLHVMPAQVRECLSNLVGGFTQAEHDPRLRGYFRMLLSESRQQFQ